MSQLPLPRILAPAIISGALEHVLVVVYGLLHLFEKALFGPDLAYEHEPKHHQGMRARTHLHANLHNDLIDSIPHAGLRQCLVIKLGHGTY